MALFGSVASKLQYWLANQQKLSLKGVTAQQWCLLAGSYFREILFKDTHLIVCSDQDEAEEVYEALKHLGKTYFYPAHGHSLYSSILTSESNLLARWAVIQKLLTRSPMIIVTTWEGATLLGPSAEFFKENSFTLSKDDIISPFDLAERLTKMGY